MIRFTLECGRWYAMIMLGDGFDSAAMCYLSPSPIRIDKVEPMKSGNRRFRLGFFHANYPEGVQGKEYCLKTIHRGRNGALLEAEGYEPPRFHYITDISMEWLKHNFPNNHYSGDSPEQALDRMYGFA